MIKIKKPEFVLFKISRKILIPVSIILVTFLFYHSLFLGRMYPGTFIAGVNVSGKTPEETTNYLQNNFRAPKEITLIYKDESFTIPFSSLDVTYDYTSTTTAAYQTFRSSNVLNNLFLPLISPFKEKIIPLKIEVNKDNLLKSLSTISGGVSQEPVYPSIYLSSGKIVVEKGSPGYEIDEEKIANDIISHLSLQKEPKITISTKKVDPSLTGFEAVNLYERGNTLLNKTIAFTFEFQELFYSKNDILTLLNPKGGYVDEKIDSLVLDVSTKVERESQNPVFVFQDGKVKEFAPSKNGVEVKKSDLADIVKNSLNELETADKKFVSIEIPTINTPSEYKIEDVNNLGINQLLGRGVSRFTGSIQSRIHNITLASSKFNGVLIKPEETFSFNDSLGDVSAFTGYQQAYIIQEGKTILGDGGGVCQVSTTLFRAALNAGLPIIERRAHAYRVGYYEQSSPVGLDATVFSPTTDFKFKNDTPGHLLIQTSVDTKAKTLVFEIYGTSDGRVATISKPTMTNITPPPDDLYTDDPTLPAGTVKQIDWKAWGAKVIFKYTVVRNGETLIDKTFYSNYQPWQAKFLRGTGPLI